MFVRCQLANAESKKETVNQERWIESAKTQKKLKESNQNKKIVKYGHIVD